MACKPGSVSRRSGWRPFIWDGACATPHAAYPDASAEARLPDARAVHPYSALLQVGLAVPPSLRLGRWALTPPFHPYQAKAWRSDFCGAVPRPAQSRPAGISPAPCLHGARTFLSCGFSALAGAAAQPPDTVSRSGRTAQRSRGWADLSAHRECEGKGLLADRDLGIFKNRWPKTCGRIVGNRGGL